MFVKREEGGGGGGGGGGGHLDPWSIHTYTSTPVATGDQDVPSLTLAI